MDMKRLHVCWLVDEWKPSREQYVRAWQAVGWELTLWHAGQAAPPLELGLELRDVRELELPTLAYELEHRSHAVAADLVRFAVLRELGGSYTDLDVLPLHARASAEPLFGMPQGAEGALEIRFVTARAGHPLIARIAAEQQAKQRRFIDELGGYTPKWPFRVDKSRKRRTYDKIVFRTGPAMVADVVQRYALETATRFDGYLLRDATIDRTPHNDGEHMTLRIAEIRARAAFYASSSFASGLR